MSIHFINKVVAIISLTSLLCIPAYAQKPTLVLPIGHSLDVRSAAFSPDSKYIVTASEDKKAIIWDAATGELLQVLAGNKKFVYSAAYSPDGKKIVTASEDKSVRIWDAVSGEEAADRRITGNYTYNSALYSADCAYIITAAEDDSAKIWDAETGKLLYTLAEHARSAELSPDGRFLLTACDDNNAIIWNIGGGTAVHNLEKHEDRVNSASYSHDGRYIVTASKDATAIIWDALTGQMLHILTGHTGDVHSAAFSPNGDYVITASDDSTARIWDTDSGNCVYTLRGHSEGLYSAAYSPDGNSIVTASKDNTARIWDAKKYTLSHTLKGHTADLYSAHYSPDGKCMATASRDFTVKIWSPATSALKATLKGHTDRVRSVAYSTDGKYIVTGSDDTTAKIWEVATAKCMLTLKGHNAGINSAAFSPDGKHVVTASLDNMAQVWDAQTGLSSFTLAGHTKPIGSASYSPDGKYIVSASFDRTACIWDAATGDTVRTLQHTNHVRSASFSPNGKYIVTATANKTAKIWDVATGALLLTCSGHNEAVISAEFSHDNKHIVTASEDNTAKIWDAVTGKCQLTLTGHTDDVYSASYSPDGTHVITASLDNTVKVWDAETGRNLYTLIPVDNEDYLVVDTDFHYDGTEAARNILYFTCGLDVVSLNQFKDLCWEPNLASKIMGGNKEAISAQRLSEINICNNTPRIENEGFSEDEYHYRIIPANGGLGETMLFVNNKQVKTYEKSELVKDGASYLLAVPQDVVTQYFTSGENKVTVTSLNAQGNMQSRGVTFVSIETKTVAKPNVYIVSVGVSKYKGDNLKLRYAAKDAGDFSKAVGLAAKKLFDNKTDSEYVHTYLLSTDEGNRQPTKDNIKQAFENIAALAGPDDILVIFLAGHGVIADAKKFYYLTYEASAFDLSGVEDQVAISTEELSKWMREIKAQKQLLILDACHSGMALPNITKREMPADQKKALERMKDRTGTYILTASSAAQAAYEADRYGQGLLTYSLLYGIKKGEGLKNNKIVDVSDWFNFASDKVKDLAKSMQGNQDPQMLGNASFDIGIADQGVKDSIHILSDRKKVFRRSNFIGDINLVYDNIGLDAVVDEKLSDAASEDICNFVYEPNNSTDTAYAIHGTYEVRDNSISAKVVLLKGHSPIDKFEKSCTLDKKEELADMIVKDVKLFLANEK